MKNCKSIITALIILVSVPIFGQPDMSKYVKPSNYVNDFAGIISLMDEDSLNTKLSNYEKSSGVEIAILTINEEYVNPASFCQEIFEKWGIGKEGSDNGILIFLNMNTHDWRIHTGYGAEILLPDLACDRLAQELLIPQFREEKYTAGINNLVNGIISKIGTNSADIEAFKAQQIALRKQRVHNFLNGLMWFFIIAIILTAGGFAIVQLLKKIEERKKLKDDTKLALRKLNITLGSIQSVSENIDTPYMAKLLKPVDDLIDLAILATGKISKENLNDIQTYWSTASEISLKVNEYVRNYNIAIHSDSYLTTAIAHLSNMQKISTSIETFPISPRLIYDKEKVKNTKSNMEKLVRTAQNADVLGSVSVIDAVNNMVRYLEQIKAIEYELNEVKDRIPRLQNVVKNYKNFIDALIARLKSMNLNDAIVKVEQMTKEFEKNVTFTDEKLFMEYDALDAILKYGNLRIREVEEAIAAERRRKEEEERRIRRKKQEEEEEEERARRRRSSSYSSGYGSGRSSFGGGGSSFGGFGGGSSGGGGAGGRW